jgi:cytochrome c
MDSATRKLLEFVISKRVVDFILLEKDWRQVPANNKYLTDLLYRSALKGKGGNWTEANIDKWLKSPADYAPGNSMAFAGIPNAKDRADLVAYLKTKTAP